MSPERIAEIVFYVQVALLFIQILTLIALVIYVIKTWEMASASRKSAEIAEKTLVEMRDTRDEENAPYVVAYLDVPNEDRQLYLVIKNTGKTMAANVKISFDPPLNTPYPEMLAKVLPKNGIPSLPPNYEIKTVIDSFPTYKQYGPMAYRVNLEYSGGTNNKIRTAGYDIDLELHRGTISAKAS